MKLTYLIILLSHLPIFITTGYAFFVFKTLTKELKVFSYYLFATGVFQMLALILALNKVNNLPLVHLDTALSFIFLAWFYTSVLEAFINKKIILITCIVFLIFIVLNSLFVQTLFTFNSYALTLESIIVIILSLSTFMLLLNDIVKEKTKQNIKSINWINSGLFIYFSSSLLIFYFGDFFTRNFPVQFNFYIWSLHSFFSVAMYTCFFIGLWKQSKS